MPQLRNVKKRSLEDSFDIIQYQVKRLCNKPESNTDLLPLFWTSILQLQTSKNQAQLVRGQVRKIHITTPLLIVFINWTLEPVAFVLVIFLV